LRLRPSDVNCHTVPGHVDPQKYLLFRVKKRALCGGGGGGGSSVCGVADGGSLAAREVSAGHPFALIGRS
jgi:hypothetical protein